MNIIIVYVKVILHYYQQLQFLHHYIVRLSIQQHQPIETLILVIRNQRVIQQYSIFLQSILIINNFHHTIQPMATIQPIIIIHHIFLNHRKRSLVYHHI